MRSQRAARRRRLPSRDRSDRRRRQPRRVLAGLQLGTGATAAIGGILLATAPDGSLLKADPAALDGSPFDDYRRPGILLATLVGGGFLVAGARQGWSAPGARAVSAAGGVGLVLFEGAKCDDSGFSPSTPSSRARVQPSPAWRCSGPLSAAPASRHAEA